MQYPFSDWLAEMASESLELPDEAGGGASANMWSMSFGTERLPTRLELKQFISSALELRRAQAKAFEGVSATFYLWHDEPAGQMRFSVARCLPGSLPFRRPLTSATMMDEIIDKFLASARVDGVIPWREFEEAEYVEDATKSELEPELSSLLVWARQLA